MLALSRGRKHLGRLRSGEWKLAGRGLKQRDSEGKQVAPPVGRGSLQDLRGNEREGAAESGSHGRGFLLGQVEVDDLDVEAGRQSLGRLGDEQEILRLDIVVDEAVRVNDVEGLANARHRLQEKPPLPFRGGGVQGRPWVQPRGSLGVLLDEQEKEGLAEIHAGIVNAGKVGKGLSAGSRGEPCRQARGGDVRCGDVRCSKDVFGGSPGSGSRLGRGADRIDLVNAVQGEALRVHLSEVEDLCDPGVLEPPQDLELAPRRLEGLGLAHREELEGAKLASLLEVLSQEHLAVRAFGERLQKPVAAQDWRTDSRAHGFLASRCVTETGHLGAACPGRSATQVKITFFCVTSSRMCQICDTWAWGKSSGQALASVSAIFPRRYTRRRWRRRRAGANRGGP
jgi:hypothetical protein